MSVLEDGELEQGDGSDDPFFQEQEADEGILTPEEASEIVRESGGF